MHLQHFGRLLRRSSDAVNGAGFQPTVFNLRYHPRGVSDCFEGYIEILQVLQIIIEAGESLQLRRAKWGHQCAADSGMEHSTPSSQEDTNALTWPATLRVRSRQRPAKASPA